MTWRRRKARRTDRWVAGPSRRCAFLRMVINALVGCDFWHLKGVLAWLPKDNGPGWPRNLSLKTSRAWGATTHGDLPTEEFVSGSCGRFLSVEGSVTSPSAGQRGRTALGRPVSRRSQCRCCHVGTVDRWGWGGAVATGHESRLGFSPAKGAGRYMEGRRAPRPSP